VRVKQRIGNHQKQNSLKHSSSVSAKNLTPALKTFVKEQLVALAKRHSQGPLHCLFSEDVAGTVSFRPGLHLFSLTFPKA
jgi:hypothetical protein